MRRLPLLSSLLLGMMSSGTPAAELAGAPALPTWTGADAGDRGGRAATGDGDATGRAAPPGEGTVAEPAGFRMNELDAPVPEGLRGARTVGAVEVRALGERGALVVDVVPAHRAPATLPTGQLWLPPEHAGVPGALWLPDTGFGALDEVTERYFLDHLDAASEGDRGHALVFYCRMDCWMSWNAAKRALAAGYTDVHWFRDGIDDWRFEGFATETLVIAPGERLPLPGAR